MKEVQMYKKTKKSLIKVEYDNDSLLKQYDNIVILIRGAPGSGKSTYANKLNLTNKKIFEADQYFYNDKLEYKFVPANLGKAHLSCYNRFTDFLKSDTGLTAIQSNTNINIRDMKPYIKYTLKNKYRLIVINILSQYTSIHNVPQEVVDRMNNNLKPFNISDYK